MIKKCIFAAFSAIVLFSASLQAAQPDMLKYNYKRNGYVYTGAERVKAESASSPVYIKLGKIAFPDGVPVYVLRLDFESEFAWKMPKGASITFDLSDGSSVVSKHSSSSANLVAPNGIGSGSDKRYWNFGEYYLEERDMKKLISGVTSIDAARRMSASGHVKLSFKDNAFSKALARAFDAIKDAPVPTIELGKHLTGVNDTAAGSRLASTETLDAGAGLSVYMSYIYSPENNSESYDLVLLVPGKTLALGSAVTFVTSAGEYIRLKQEKDLSEGYVICYPDASQIKRLAEGIVKVTMETIGGEVSIVLPDNILAKAIGTLYNSLQTIAIL